MNTDFESWLEGQIYTLSGIFSFKWRELIYLANYNRGLTKTDRKEYTWGLWRKIRINDNAGGSNQEDQTE